MNTIKQKIKNIYIPLNIGSLSLFFSILAIGYVSMASNSPCLEAQSTCAIGANNEFSGTISINSSGNKGTFDASNNTGDRTYDLPDTTGTLALTSDIPSTPSLTASKSVATDGAGDLTTTDTYPLSLTASKSINTNVSGELETNDVYPLTLTADTPLKTNVSGEVTATDLVPETDLTVGSGSAGQVLAVNTGATALEFIDSGGGGRWTLVASGESHETATAMSTYESAGDSVQICWGGASSTDGTDGNYFRMTDGKRYKLVFAPNNSISSSIINSSGYSGHGISYIGSSVDCVNGANPQSYTSSAGYSFSSTDWFYYWNANIYNSGASYHNNTWNCNILAWETIQADYGIQNWSGEIDLWDIYTDWNGGVDQIVANWDIMFGVKDFNSPYDLKDPARSSGTCASVGTTPGGTVSKMSDMYGFYFNNFRPSGTGGDGILYWLYESNEFNNRP